MPKLGFKYRHKETEKFCGVGMWNPRVETNVGTLFRSAHALGQCDFSFTIGLRYGEAKSDTICSYRRKPCFNFDDKKDFMRHLPMHCELVAVEMGKRSTPIEKFKHPPRAIYLFGAEDEGLPWELYKSCRRRIQLPACQDISMNLSAAGTAVFMHRYLYLNGLLK